MPNLNHLDAIDLRLSHERSRVTAAKPGAEREWREHNVRMIERERAGELAFLAKQGYVEPAPMTLDEIMNDEDLLAMLND